MKVLSKEARIENTNLCNTQCACCPRELMTRPLATMPLWLFERVAHQCRNLGVELIQIGGYGEPLMDPDIFIKIVLVKKLGIETFITTNGSLLSSDRIDNLLAIGLDNLRISVHGFNDSDYQKVHGLSWEVLQHHLKLLERKRSKKRTKVHITTMPLHGESVEDIVAAVGSYCDYLEVWRPHNWAGGRFYRRASGTRKACSRPFTGPLQINADGRMMVCCFDYDAQLAVGNTWDESIEHILKGRRFEEIRAAHRSGNLQGLICEACDQMYEQDQPALIWRSGYGAANRRTTYGHVMG